MENKNYYTERYRPQFHFTAEKSWLNDPNGLIYHDEYYHLFYQNHPESKNWGSMHWGHARSKDLLHWEHLPIALYPNENGACFSGSAVFDNNNTSGLFEKNGYVAIFTQNERAGYKIDQKQSIAYSNDAINWNIYANNPVIPNSIVNEEHFRDPKVFYYKDLNKWIMVVGGGYIRIFSSDNLIDWKLEQTTDIWSECPDLFPINYNNETKWVLLLSSERYYVGDFDGLSYKPTQEVKEIVGPDLYAGQSFNDEPNNRRVIINWMADFDYIHELSNLFHPFNGVMSLPYELSLEKNDNEFSLIINPVEEVKKLRKEEEIFKNVKVNGIFNFNNYSLSTNDIELTIDLNQYSGEGIQINIFKNQYEKVVLGYDINNEVLYLDRTENGTGKKKINHFKRRYDTKLNNEGILKLRIIIDVSTIEVFANDGKAILAAYVFSSPTAKDLEIIGDKEFSLIEARLYKMSSIYRDIESIEPIKINTNTEKVLVKKGNYSNFDAAVYPYKNVKIDFECSNNDIIQIINTDNNCCYFYAREVGECAINAKYNGLSNFATIVVYEENLSSEVNLVNEKMYTGTVLVRNGIEMEGDGFYYSNDEYDNFELSTEFNLVSGYTASIVFAGNDDLSKYYCASYDFNHISLKIWSSDNPAICYYKKAVLKKNVTNKITLKVDNNVARVYLNDEKFANAVIKNDNGFKGRVGVHVYNSVCSFQNIKIKKFSGFKWFKLVLEFFAKLWFNFNH